jgi:hypothetical protein
MSKIAPTSSGERNLSSSEKACSPFRQWSALSTCLSVTIASFLFLFCLASAGWPGQVTSNCYEDYLITADCYCERLRGAKPGDAWFAQPMNTISNLWFVAAGLLIAYAADTRKLPSKEWWESNSNLITQDKLYATMCGLNACLVGVGSTFLHASFTAWGRQMDMIAMYFIATFSFLYPLLRQGHMTKEQFVVLYFWSNVCLIYWVVNVANPEQSRKLFSATLLTSWIIELFMVDSETAKRNSKARRILITNIGMFMFAALVWKSSESGGPMCYPDSLFQGHSLWHLQSAVAIAGLFLYYLADKGTPDPKLDYFAFPKPPLSRASDSSSESDSVL